METDVEVDFESSIDIKWIIGRVPVEEHNEVIKEETKWIDTLKASEKRRKREEIKKNMIDMYNDEDTDIESLAIAHMGASKNEATLEDGTTTKESK